MSKQDRQGVRTPRDLEQKYGFGKSFSEVKESLKVATETAEQAEKQALKAHSEVLQLSDSIKLTVENGETTAQIKLKVGDKEIPATIDMKGLVTFANLANADGTTVINGSNITTGQILADLIKAGTIKSKDGKSLVINLDSGESSFTTTAEVYLEPDEPELTTIWDVSWGNRTLTDEEIPLYDRNGDGVVDLYDYQLFMKAVDGKTSIFDGWDKGTPSTLTITINAKDTDRTVHISGVNMWGREIDAYFGAQGISASGELKMNGCRILGLPTTYRGDETAAASQGFVDYRIEQSVRGFGLGVNEGCMHYTDANHCRENAWYTSTDRAGFTNVPTGKEKGIIWVSADTEFVRQKLYYYDEIYTRSGKKNGSDWNFTDWTNITYGLPKVGNELVSPVNIKAPNFIGTASRL